MKAQIVRISAACDLTPRGIYKTRLEEGQEETGFEELDKEEEVKREKLEFYLNPENWLHLSPEVTVAGRTTREEPEFADDLEEDAKEAIKKQLAKLVTPAKRLQPITKDKCCVIR